MHPLLKPLASKLRSVDDKATEALTSRFNNVRRTIINHWWSAMTNAHHNIRNTTETTSKTALPSNDTIHHSSIRWCCRYAMWRNRASDTTRHVTSSAVTSQSTRGRDHESFQHLDPLIDHRHTLTSSWPNDTPWQAMGEKATRETFSSAVQNIITRQQTSLYRVSLPRHPVLNTSPSIPGLRGDDLGAVPHPGLLLHGSSPVPDLLLRPGKTARRTSVLYVSCAVW